MMDATWNPVTKRCADHSTMEAFRFSFCCDRCAKEWHSARYDFNPGGFAPPIDPAIYQVLWNEQRKAAYERANRDACFEFNRCPACGRRVCKACFHLSGTGVSDVCKDCIGSWNPA